MASGDVVWEKTGTPTNYKILGRLGTNEQVYEYIFIGDVELNNVYASWHGSPFLEDLDPNKSYKITVKEV